jgi:hypothetical protein
MFSVSHLIVLSGSKSARSRSDQGARHFSKGAVVLILLCGAQFLFLWMFFAADGLEHAAKAGYLYSSDGRDVARIASQYASDWRHGMSGGWPVYVPGFFAVAIATWVWPAQRCVKRLLVEALFVSLASTLAAVYLAPAGSIQIVKAFRNDWDIRLMGNLTGPTYRGIGHGLNTLLTWTIFVLSSKKALRRKSFRPYWLPLCLAIGLALTRPMTADHLIWAWYQGVLRADERAIVSLLLVLVVGVCLALFQQWEDRRVASVQKSLF